MSCELASILQQQTELLASAFETLDAHSSGKMWLILISGVVSTILGAGLTYFAGKYKDKRHSKQRVAQAFLELLIQFEDRCLDYWSKNYDAETSMVEEARIKAAYRQLRQYSQVVDIGLSDTEQNQLRDKISKLFEAATGGDFESANRKASRGQTQRIALICSQVSPILLQGALG